MPSKTKKHSKTPSRLSNSDPSASPRTPSSSSMPSLDSQICEEDFQSILEDASSRYPSLIGKSAFVGQVTDVVETESRGCKIWLSESSMLASSLAPGSLISVIYDLSFSYEIVIICVNILAFTEASFTFICFYGLPIYNHNNHVLDC